MEFFSLYFHIPFCIHRCGYCDFNTYAGLGNLIPDYVDALCKEILWVKSYLNEPLPVRTVFFGGGTPSLISAKQYEKIFLHIQQSFDLAGDAEISLEVNPGTISLEYLKALRSISFNRISIGMQTANPDELRLLERQHDVFDALKAVSWAREADFSNLNLDLIFGLPGQSLQSWIKSLSTALSLEPEHLALYALSIEHGTPFDHWNQRGLLDRIDQDKAADMYEYARSILESSGYLQYEISNWARHHSGAHLPNVGNPHYACKHNLQYWHNLPYLGFGAGAHGYDGIFRTANVLSPKAYIQRINNPFEQKEILHSRNFPHTPATVSSQAIDPVTEIGETMMMGLRLTREGIPVNVFQERFNLSLLEKFRSQISRLEKLGLIEWIQAQQTHLRLTAKGHLLGNQVFMEFIES